MVFLWLIVALANRNESEKTKKFASENTTILVSSSALPSEPKAHVTANRPPLSDSSFEDPAEFEIRVDDLIEARDENTVGELCRLLKQTRDPHQTEYILAAVSAMDLSTDQIEALLTVCFENPELAIQRAAIQYMVDEEGPHPPALLARAANHRDQTVQVLAIAAADLAPEPTRQVVYQNASHSRSEDVLLALVATVSSDDSPAIHQVLTSLVSSNFPRVRHAAEAELTHLLDSESILENIRANAAKP